MENYGSRSSSVCHNQLSKLENFLPPPVLNLNCIENFIFLSRKQCMTEYFEQGSHFCTCSAESIVVAIDGTRRVFYTLFGLGCRIVFNVVHISITSILVIEAIASWLVFRLVNKISQCGLWRHLLILLLRTDKSCGMFSNKLKNLSKEWCATSSHRTCFSKNVISSVMALTQPIVQR